MTLTKHLILAALALAGCKDSEPADSTLTTDSVDTAPAWEPGDAALGFSHFVDGDYIRCGIPEAVYQQYIGSGDRRLRLDGRSDANSQLPYMFTSITTPEGVDLVTSNCLSCHATYFNGEIVVGLGNSLLDFTQDQTAYAAVMPALNQDESAQAEADLWAERMVAVSASVVTEVRGMNSADTLAQALFAHRDPTTLAWLDEPAMALPDASVPTDVPPLWHMRKKDRMLYTGAGTGNLPRIMMTATALCTDEVAEAEDIYAMFPHIRAYFASIEPPAFPSEVDSALAEQGEQVFERSCSECHGTYGSDWTYPNRVVPLADIGTDPALVTRMDDEAQRFTDWYNGSWYGQDTQLEDTGGYIAPPLDGVWVTAPYLHNASIPTLQALLDSSLRPAFWSRLSLSYDSNAVGWSFESYATAGEFSGDDIELYDTTRPGYSNGGHTFGDALSEQERVAVLEYLKTL